MWNKRNISAFTLIEILIVITILAILITIGALLLTNNINKGNDAKRKADLQRISVAFEEYYTDHNCYPLGDVLKTCGGNGLAPYLNNIPCDPIYNSPYCYLPDTDKPTCFQKFNILTTLKYLADPAIAQLGCNSKSYCGWETECHANSKVYGYNFGLSSSNATVGNTGIITIPTPPGLPSPGLPGILACDPNGICNAYGSSAGKNGCPITFSDTSTCDAYCKYPQFRCKE
jgi:prepilin-type N-terminal cleavage/methylation domain-containing protein